MFKVNYDSIIFILTTILCSFFVIFESKAGTIPIITVSLLILFFHLKKKKWKYKINFGYFHLSSFIFAFYCILTSVWAYDSSSSIKVGVAIIKMIFIISILYNYYIEKNSIKELLNSIIWAGYIVTFYAYYYYGVNKIIKYLLTNQRLENGDVNINSIGIFLTFSILVSFFYFIYIHKKIVFSNIFSIFSFFIIIATASRKAVVAFFLGLFLIISLRYCKKNILLNIFKIIILTIFTFSILKILLSLEIFNGINERMEGLISLLTKKGKIDHSGFLRQEYIKLGLRYLKENFWIGIGMDNTYLITSVIENRKTYLHNNYIEILVGGGIFAFILFYEIYLYILLKFLKYRKIKNLYTKICYIFIFLILLLQYGNVTYFYKMTYFYLFIFFTQIEILKKNFLKINM